MNRWVCTACGSLWAPGAPCCPACRSAEHTEEEGTGMPKIGPDGTVTYEPGREPDAGHGQPGPGAAAPEDETVGAAPGEQPEGTAVPDPEPPPEPEPDPAPAPRVPPRRMPPKTATT